MSTPKKRHTKAQKEAVEIAAIRARLYDILQGAQGGFSRAELDNPDGNHCISQVVGIVEFSRFMGAIGRIWPEIDVRMSFLGFTRLRNFDTLDASAEYLHSHGCRA